MLGICTDFAKQYNIVFNANKTMCIKFGAPDTPQDSVYLDNNATQWVDQVKHLGNIVHSNLPLTYLIVTVIILLLMVL